MFPMECDYKMAKYRQIINVKNHELIYKFYNKITIKSNQCSYVSNSNLRQNT